MSKEEGKKERSIWYSNIRCPRCNRRFKYDGIKFFCNLCGMEIDNDKDLDKIKDV